MSVELAQELRAMAGLLRRDAANEKIRMHQALYGQAGRRLTKALRRGVFASHGHAELRLIHEDAMTQDPDGPDAWAFGQVVRYLREKTGLEEPKDQLAEAREACRLLADLLDTEAGGLEKSSDRSPRLPKVELVRRMLNDPNARARAGKDLLKQHDLKGEGRHWTVRVDTMEPAMRKRVKHGLRLPD